MKVENDTEIFSCTNGEKDEKEKREEAKQEEFQYTNKERMRSFRKKEKA